MSVVSFEHPSEYKVLEVLGNGTYGVVCKAERTRGEGDAKTVDVVAIKRIALPKFAFVGDEFAVRRLRFACRELEILRCLQQCPQIVHIEDLYWSADGGDLYIVMQYVPYSAWKLIHEEHLKPLLTETNCRRVAAQLFLGLHAIHSLKILHRDLAASNVLVDPNTCLTVIADFGLSKVHLEGCEKPTVEVVTEPYKAPEVLAKCRTQNPAMDIWSAGCVVMELATKRSFMYQNWKQRYEDFFTAIVDHVTGAPSPSDVKCLCTLQGFQEKISLVEGLVGRAPKGANWKDDARNAGLSEDGISVLASIFVFDPSKRPTALEVLGMPWFTADEDCKNFIEKELGRMSEWLTEDYKVSTEKVLKEIEESNFPQLQDLLRARVKKFASTQTPVKVQCRCQ
jgi:serine/threonine protein kinase